MIRVHSGEHRLLYVAARGYNVAIETIDAQEVYFIANKVGENSISESQNPYHAGDASERVDASADNSGQPQKDRAGA